ncbi:hypothetical protein HF086_006409 [Spodoptera exigua]|uniref:Gustatory receptor n=1 Tax=Spodoptera exigua TaxID=7107 RepID=A0A922MX77_SPOEX|nr:hypothetical protein HF086_006409 [Spodoptera exigua]
MTVSIGIQTGQTAGAYEVCTSSYFIANFMWILRSIFLLSSLCNECEQLYKALNESQTVNIRFMNSKKWQGKAQVYCMILFICLWAMKSLLTEIVLSLSCEEFYKSMDRIQNTCVIILKSNCSGKSITHDHILESMGDEDFSCYNCSKFLLREIVQSYGRNSEHLRIYFAIQFFRLIKLLTNQVDLWNVQIQNMAKVDNDQLQIFSRNMFNAYVNILKSYDLFVACFQHMAVTAVVFDFISITMIKGIVYEITFSLYSERFYNATDKAQNLCALILQSKCSVIEKRLCKNIQRLHRVNFDKINICRIFYIDVNFPLKMISLVTNYIIVLVLFACDKECAV